MLVDGLHIPLTTPFHPDGRLNPRKLASNVARYSKTPAAGLIVLGPSAEPTLLSDEETREVLRIAAEAAAPEKVLIAGFARDSVRATLNLANYAADLNYDATLIGIPSVLAPETHTRELITYFQTIADRSPLPILLLSTGRRAILIETIAELAAHPNILGLLNADPSANIAAILALSIAVRREVTVTPTFAAVTPRMKKAASQDAAANLVSTSSLIGSAATAVAEPPPAAPPLRTRTKTVGFQVVSVHTPAILAGLRAGATAIAPAFAACAPQACYEVFAAWKDDDQPLADEKQARLIEAAHLAEVTPGTLKFACDLNGYFGGLPRLPHLPPTGAQRAVVEQQMKELRN